MRMAFVPCATGCHRRSAACAGDVRARRKPVSTPRRGATVAHSTSLDATPSSRAVPELGEYVQQSLRQNFEAADIQRVFGAWENLKNDLTLSSYDDDGEVLQLARSFVDGLTARAWHDVGEYPWALALQQRWTEVRDELQKALAMPSLEKRGNNVWTPAVRDDAMAYGRDWRTLVLQDRGMWEPRNSKIFKQTIRVLRECKVPSSEVFFARQAPHTGIKPHTDDTNFILTCHLALDVPEKDCWIRVGKERREWRDGEAMVFDTSFLHETYNGAETQRYVLLIRFWHPELTRKEVRALEHIFRCIEDYEARYAATS